MINKFVRTFKVFLVILWGFLILTACGEDVSPPSAVLNTASVTINSKALPWWPHVCRN